MRSRRIIAGVFLLVWFVASGTPAFAAPLPLTVSPSTARPGQTIHVSVAGLAGLPVAGKTGCLGILGPGQNVERNVAPQFRPQIGLLAVAANGTGQADAQLPSNLVAGRYRVIFGGCSPHGNIAPLTTIAQAMITVIGPTATTPSVSRLPAAGGPPLVAAALAALIGVGAVALGLALRKTGDVIPDDRDSRKASAADR